MSIKMIRNLLVIALLLIGSAGANAQCITKKKLKMLSRQVNKNGNPGIIGDSVLQEIRKSASLTLGYAEYNNTRRYTPVIYYLISLSKKNCIVYKYTKLYTVNAGEKNFHIDTLEFPALLTDSLPGMLKMNAAWSLKHDEKADDDPCSHDDPLKIRVCTIHDASSKLLFLSTPTRQVAASYYAPDYYEHTCCPGNPERQRFLNVVRFIYTAFLKSNPGQ